jgi:hypothetical protein
MAEFIIGFCIGLLLGVILGALAYKWSREE